MSLTKTKIPYLDYTWPIVTGCSYGCPECWARRVAHRFGWSFEPDFHPDRLFDPAKRKKPAVIGVAFGGDLFDPALTDPQFFSVTGAMLKAPHHAYVLLTKRAAQMATVATQHLLAPHPNWFLGVTVRNQLELSAAAIFLKNMKHAGWRTWISIEPMQGPIDFFLDYSPNWIADVVILGGQSGPGAVPLDPDWVRSVRDQCAAVGVTFCFKQWSDNQWDQKHGGPIYTKDGWPLLDGRIHTALPWKLATKELPS